MGWFGLVFKGDVRHVSDHLAVGLTTGFMGSLTTFSGWNQKMLDLSSEDHWVFAAAGIVLGKPNTCHSSSQTFFPPIITSLGGKEARRTQ